MKGGTEAGFWGGGSEGSVEGRRKMGTVGGGRTAAGLWTWRRRRKCCVDKWRKNKTKKEERK